ncbi:hypothetical protein IFM89_031409, partial [Coptis chinensis]
AIETGFISGRLVSWRSYQPGTVMAVDMSYHLGWIDESIVKQTYNILEQAKLPTTPPKIMNIFSPSNYMIRHGFRKTDWAAYMLAKYTNAADDAFLSFNAWWRRILLEDIATRVIAEGLRPEQTIVSKIMTRNPVFVGLDSLVIEALQKMVQGWWNFCLSDA